MIVEAPPRVSVIMGFRDWGLERLELALKAHRLSTMSSEMELIVVDYGSKDDNMVRETANRWEAQVYRVESLGPWNRSHCLNVGIRAARSPRVLTTDADILFHPRTIQVILESLSDERDFVLVQCRDLPALTPQELSRLDFDYFARQADLRPPWGMGGCACFRKTLAREIRGYDERLEWWGSEDNDFVQRALQHGDDVRWLDNPDARCYHMWHPKLTEVNSQNNQFLATVKRNRNYAAHDTTIVRNALPWGVTDGSRPAISACIVTHNRAHLIGQTIESLLEQTWKDFEIVIVDDGSTDETTDTIKAYDDPRIRYFKTKHEGIPNARNIAVLQARGDYICIVDDDDVQLPDRIERHLSAVEDGYVGSYGGWIDFDEESSELFYNPGRAYSLEALLFAQKVLLHPTTCILREVLMKYKYDPKLPYGSDFDLALRIAGSGYKLKHVGAYLILRRLHQSAVTTLHSSLQRRSGHRTRKSLMAALTPEEVQSARMLASQSAPMNLNDPFEDRSLLLRLRPSVARFLLRALSRRTPAETLKTDLGRARVLERRHQVPARLEVGPFSSMEQCSMHLRRLRRTTDQDLSIESRSQGTTDIVYYVTWPWTVEREAWFEQDRIDRTYRYPNDIALQQPETPQKPVTDSFQSVLPRPAGPRARGGNDISVRLKEIAAKLFPSGSQILVVSKGDDRLIELGTATGLHFPQTDEGVYSGFHPADSTEAISQLNKMRDRGASYLVVPASCFWWLEYYETLRRHLQKNFRLIYFEEDVCLIYALDSNYPETPNGLKKRLLIPVRACKKPSAMSRVDVEQR
jgi:glycosyltransferase involved in cell wall biosynthesis